MRLRLGRHPLLLLFAWSLAVPARADGGFQVTGSPPPPQAEAPRPLEPILETTDYRTLDAAALDRYDAAFELDRSTATAEEKRLSWLRLAREFPHYSKTARARAAQWEDYLARRKAAEEARPKRIAARNFDWGKLEPLLLSTAVPQADKTRWTAEFLNAYSDTLGIDPSMSPAAAARAARATMHRAVTPRTLEAAGGMLWITIPSGAYTMGTTDYPESRPLHNVAIKSFQMAKTLVTNKQYRACVAARACTPAHVGRCFVYAGGWSWGRLPERFQGDDQPAVCVDWEQAGMFAEWVGGRLPSEAEWEFAARGAARDWKYPWGDQDPTCERALVRGCGSGASAPVCATPAGNTLQGLCDMAGDVWEWVRDSYHPSYEGAPTDGRAWDVASSSHVARGGSMYDDGEKARCSYRSALLSGAYYHVGFRPVR